MITSDYTLLKEREVIKIEPQTQEFEAPVKTPTLEDEQISITLRDLKEVSVQIKTKQKELKERLELNPTYESVNEEYKGVAKTRKDTKLAVIAKDENMKKLDGDLKSLKVDKKELENALSDDLMEFSNKTGQLSFLADDGTVIEFERVAKLRIKGA
jgi:hypothetical protein